MSLQNCPPVTLRLLPPARPPFLLTVPQHAFFPLACVKFSPRFPAYSPISPHDFSWPENQFRFSAYFIAPSGVSLFIIYLYISFQLNYFASTLERPLKKGNCPRGLISLLIMFLQSGCEIDLFTNSGLFIILIGSRGN